ncbi:MAG: Lrp/AsnC family transcriptional regulator [Deltaproteobacteria bacterium]
MGYSLSSLDRRILNLLQKDFPLSDQPFMAMAAELDIDEADLLKRIGNMKEAGIIRRIGAIIESRAIGYYSTLCACRVENDRADEVAAIINGQTGVTHNYLRDQEYNLWFTLTCESEEKARRILTELEDRTGLPILSMPAEQVYKIRLALDMSEKNAI